MAARRAASKNSIARRPRKDPSVASLLRELDSIKEALDLTNQNLCQVTQERDSANAALVVKNDALIVALDERDEARNERDWFKNKQDWALSELDSQRRDRVRISVELEKALMELGLLRKAHLLLHQEVGRSREVSAVLASCLLGLTDDGPQEALARLSREANLMGVSPEALNEVGDALKCGYVSQVNQSISLVTS